MKRKISVLVVSAMTFGVMQLGMAAPASACADPNCPWSPVKEWVHDTCYGTAGRLLEPNPCP